MLPLLPEPLRSPCSSAGYEDSSGSHQPPPALAPTLMIYLTNISIRENTIESIFFVTSSFVKQSRILCCGEYKIYIF